jgi:alkanesulfonate monooxygenase SsuD/methylene tetrahydromethanopterin reductase-like flavin-dependent oxidoreductase (luciferase family)
METSMACVTPLRLAVALRGAGWHPAAGSGPDGAPADLGSSARWSALIEESERGKLDFVTLEDAPSDDPQPEPLELALIAARVAAASKRIGLIPAVTGPPATQISTAIADLDRASAGRAGWLAGPGPTSAAVDEVAEVRRWWQVREDAELAADPAGPARSPQGRPVVVARANQDGSSPAAAAPGGADAGDGDPGRPYRFAAAAADLLLISPVDDSDIRPIVAAVRAEESRVGRSAPAVRIFADLVVLLADTEAAAAERQARLDDRHGSAFTADAAVFVGTPSRLGRLLQVWQQAGLDGFRLRPATLADDLPAITRGLVPSLQENDAFRRGYEVKNLRALLGLPRPVDLSLADR